jgi:hypothetical protein
MTTAAQIAEIHLGPINASRKRTGLAALTLSRDSQFGQRIRGPLAVEICDGVVARTSGQGAWGARAADIVYRAARCARTVGECFPAESEVR